MVRVGVTTGGCADAADMAVLDHRVELTLRLSPAALEGYGEVRVRALAPASVVQLDTAGLNVSSASSRGVSLQFKRAGDSTCVELPQPLAAGDELTLALAWRAKLPEPTPTFAADQAWAGSRTSVWLPTKLDLAQRATLSLSLTAPDDLKLAVSHSQLVVATSPGDGLRHVHYDVTTPISPALYAFAVGRFSVSSYYLDGFALNAFGPLGFDLMEVLELTLPMYLFFRDRTGATPPAAYTQVFVHGEAAQEALGMSLIPESVLRDLHADLAGDGIIAHELAHQWFGVLVPCAGPADLWLNEGFATFMVAVMKEQRSGRPSYDQEFARWRALSRALHTCGNDTPVSLSRPGLPSAGGVTEAELRARGVVYFRGALVLDKLRRELGEKSFWDGIRRYVAERAGKPSRTEHLQHAMTAVSGRDLREFFDRWVYAAAPDL
jgi:aminopeptidase N